MSLRLPAFALPVLALPILALLPLAACGPEKNQFAPQCPTPKLYSQLADIVSMAGPGPQHDITDLKYQARITGINGKCKPGDKPDQLDTTATVTLSVQRGPAMKGREVDLPLFIAVTEGKTVRDKKLIPVHVPFPPNVDRLTFTSPEIDMTIPVTKDKNGLAYDIVAGFQLTPDQLAAARR